MKISSKFLVEQLKPYQIFDGFEHWVLENKIKLYLKMLIYDRDIKKGTIKISDET